VRGERLGSMVTWILLDPAQHFEHRTINVALGRVAKEKMVSKTQAKVLSVLLLE
jgi:hypothetical protein